MSIDLTPAGPAYFGKLLNPEPSNFAMRKLVEALTQFSVPVYVQLDPGDSTRYDLLITPLSGILADVGGATGLPYWGPRHTLLITRLTSSAKPLASAVVCPDIFAGELDEVANGNPHTLAVLSWWINCLFAAIAKAAGDPGDDDGVSEPMAYRAV